MYIGFLTKYPSEELSKKQSNATENIVKEEWNEIKELKNNPNIVIKESNKGGASVIMDAEFYYEKMTEIVNDKRTYKKLDNNIDEKLHKKIANLTKKYHQELTKKK